MKLVRKWNFTKSLTLICMLCLVIFANLYNLDSRLENNTYNSMIASLSKGNKRKIEIIATLLHRPQFLVLDEPLSGLDTRSAVIMKEIFRLHIQQGGSILFSTHTMELAQQLCTRIGIIDNGAIVAVGTFEELQEKSNSTKPLEQLFLELTNQSEITRSIIQQLEQLPTIKVK